MLLDGDLELTKAWRDCRYLEKIDVEMEQEVLTAALHTPHTHAHALEECEGDYQLVEHTREQEQEHAVACVGHMEYMVHVLEDYASRPLLHKRTRLSPSFSAIGTYRHSSNMLLYAI